MVENLDQWDDFKVYLPVDWQELAETSGALKGLRKYKSPDNLLRVMLMHFACGCSLRETSVRAREAGLFDGSDVAIMGRIIKSQEWLRLMCEKMFRAQGVSADAESPRLRMIDASDVHEPGKTGSQWRIHYSVTLPDLRCDHFSLTSSCGKGSGESLSHFPAQEGDLLVADRGYSRAKDINYAHSHGAFVCIRLNYSMLPLFDTAEQSHRFQLTTHLKQLRNAGDMAEWHVQVFDCDTQTFIPGRLCAIRKSAQAIQKAHKKCFRKSRSNKQKTKDDTLFFNEYVLIFTTFPEDKFPLREILRIYRLRWQIELVFKRFKSLANLGHLPKHLAESSKAWLYGKLLVALLTERLIAAGGAFSPWRDASDESEELLAGIRFYVAGGAEDHLASGQPDEYSIQLG